MANAPWARLTKFIRPIVTDRPMLIRNRRLPYEIPSNRTPMKALTGASRANAPATGHAGASLARILDVGKARKLDVVEVAVLFFHAPDVDRLDDVAGRRVDHDRSARAVVLPALEHADRLVAVGVTAVLGQHFIDRRHAVESGDRHEVRTLVA